jgi:ABC-2 type transport system ATP-binding protein
MTHENKNIALEIKGLVKTYQHRKTGSKQALKFIDLTVPQGMIYGLLGPNGAGKSTLINILAGLTVKTSGEVRINGINQDDNPRLSRYQLGVVPQEVILDPFFTVEETLDYYAGYYGVPKKERRTREIMDAMHLTDKAHINSRRLSGGMKRRVLIAKALVHQPSILILDEPTAGVDVDLRFQLWEYVRKLNKQGTTILLTTHYLEEAEQLCDRIAIINHGKIVVEDTTKSLVRRLDQKQITIAFEQKLSAVPKELEKFEATLSGDHEVSIRYQKSTTSINEILTLICGSKRKVTDVTTAEPDLEDIFRVLVSTPESQALEKSA